MGRRTRNLKPGQAQIRRMWFCIRLTGLAALAMLVTAIVVGIPFPGAWNALFVPFWSFVIVVLPFITFIFAARGLWLKAKAKHYETLVKLQTDPRFK